MFIQFRHNNINLPESERPGAGRVPHLRYSRIRPALAGTRHRASGRRIGWGSGVSHGPNVQQVSPLTVTPEGRCTGHARIVSCRVGVAAPARLSFILAY